MYRVNAHALLQSLNCLPHLWCQAHAGKQKQHQLEPQDQEPMICPKCILWLLSQSISPLRACVLELLANSQRFLQLRSWNYVRNCKHNALTWATTALLMPRQVSFFQLRSQNDAGSEGTLQTLRAHWNASLGP
mmetsp:Transcript_114500/g.334762  ORF Transcript_114500/g.334762 Transcript_114500/m.334762 type:complete len:133 (+) Transcript_114500:638-1036(+)